MGEISLSFSICPASYQVLCGKCFPQLLRRITRSCKQFLEIPDAQTIIDAKEEIRKNPPSAA